MCLSGNNRAILLLQQDESRASGRGWRTGGEREQERKGERFWISCYVTFSRREENRSLEERIRTCAISPTCECVPDLHLSVRPPSIHFFSSPSLSSPHFHSLWFHDFIRSPESLLKHGCWECDIVKQSTLECVIQRFGVCESEAGCVMASQGFCDANEQKTMNNIMR